MMRQLAQVKHDHRREDGKLIQPVIEITGYPVDCMPPAVSLCAEQWVRFP